MLRTSVLLGVAASLACTTPCDDLKSRAHECRASPGRYVDDQESVCTEVRGELQADFDSFAACVEESPCDDNARIDRCQQQTLGEVTYCVRFKLWAAACGLEPIGVEDDCAALSEGMFGEGFARWVACVTDDACPRGDDDSRYEQCQEGIVPSTVTDLFDACFVIMQWSEQCAGNGFEPFVVHEMGLAQCLAEGEIFTASAYLEYAYCLEGIACDDIAGRLDCLLRLELIDPSPVIAPCERLIAFSDSCGSDLGGGSIDVCARLFARFVPASVDAFVSCVEQLPCGDADVAVVCAPRLQLE